MDAAKKNFVNRTGKLTWILTAAMGLSLLGAATAAGQDDSTTQPSTDSGAAVVTSSQIQTITLEPGQSQTITTQQRIKEANLRDPDVADVDVLGINSLLVTGKKTGVTRLIIKDEAGGTEVIQLQVSSNIETLRKHLKALFPDETIQADDDNGSITLHGQVRTLEIARQAEEIATPYGGQNKVHNLLEVGGGQQVLLEVKFAEVDKQAASQLGINLGGTDGTSFVGDNIGQINSFGTTTFNNPTTGFPMQLLSAANPAGGATTVFGQGAMGKIAFDYFVDALETNNLLRVLAEPNVITTSGQKASFMAGGQIPIPVPQSSGSGVVITIDYKDYGVQLNFTPIVLGDGRIRLEVNPDVSQLDYSHTVNISGTEVPGFTDRNVNTTVELAEGQTFTIAGLLQDNITTTNQEFPVLGDLPILGALFRSVAYQRSETELVVMVTPVLVHGVDPADVTRAPGEKWRTPSEPGLFLMKDMGGEQLNPDGSATKGPAPEYHGAVGFNPVVSRADFH